MSEVYDCLIIRAPLQQVADIYRETADSDVPYEFQRVEANVTLMYHQASRADRRFAENMDEIAACLSTRLGAVLAFEYDSRVGHRASRLYRVGELTATYGETDELWVPLDEQGNPILTTDRLHVGELLDGEEYETVENAIDLGLRAVGAGTWRDLHDFLGKL